MASKSENIYERKDGRFEARFIVSRDENGKAKYKAIYGRSKAEVREKLEKAKLKVYGEPSPHEDKTFREVAEEYLESIRDRVAKTTYDRYTDTLERDIYPEYADTPMVDVTYDELNRFMKIAPDLAEKRGRTLKDSALQIVRAVMSNVMQYAATVKDGRAEMLRSIISYEELTPHEIESICLRTKFNHCPEMLAAILSLYCGLRIGEVSGLSCDDVDLDRMEIYVHSIVHRVKNLDGDEERKTRLVVDEIARKNQIRRIKIPAVLKDYISEFMVGGRPLVRGRDDISLSDPRTLENRLIKIMDLFKLENINFERLRKTYQKGKADEQIITNVFLGLRPDAPYAGAVDRKWLTDEMAKDLAPLRMLLGLTHEEMGSLIGVSTA